MTSDQDRLLLPRTGGDAVEQRQDSDGSAQVGRDGRVNAVGLLQTRVWADFTVVGDQVQTNRSATSSSKRSIKKIRSKKGQT